MPSISGPDQARGRGYVRGGRRAYRCSRLSCSRALVLSRQCRSSPTRCPAPVPVQCARLQYAVGTGEGDLRLRLRRRGVEVWRCGGGHGHGCGASGQLRASARAEQRCAEQMTCTCYICYKHWDWDAGRRYGGYGGYGGAGDTGHTQGPGYDTGTDTWYNSTGCRRRRTALSFLLSFFWTVLALNVVLACCRSALRPAARGGSRPGASSRRRLRRRAGAHHGTAQSSSTLSMGTRASRNAVPSAAEMLPSSCTSALAPPFLPLSRSRV